MTNTDPKNVADVFEYEDDWGHPSTQDIQAVLDEMHQAEEVRKNSLTTVYSGWVIRRFNSPNCLDSTSPGAAVIRSEAF